MLKFRHATDEQKNETKRNKTETVHQKEKLVVKILCNKTVNKDI
jgi:hypothetical protein